MKEIISYLLVIFSIVITIYSIVLLLKNKRNVRLRNLIIYQFLIVLTIISVSIVDSKNAPENLKNLFSLLFYVILISIPPFLYLYNSSLSKNKVEPNYKTLNLSFGLALINLISFLYLSNFKSKDFLHLSIENIMSYANLIAFVFVFPILSIYYILKSFRIKDSISSKTIKEITIGYIILMVLLYINQASSNNLLFKSLFYLFIITYIIRILYSGLALEKMMFVETLTNQESDKLNDNVQLKYFEEINSKLDEVMFNQKPFLDSKLTIYQLAKILDTNDKYLSMYINVKLNSNFSSYINSLRIEEAKKMLNSKESRNYTLETIGNMAGFHSKSSFNSSFKKSTGMTPSEYFKSISKK